MASMAISWARAPLRLIRSSVRCKTMAAPPSHTRCCLEVRRLTKVRVPDVLRTKGDIADLMISLPFPMLSAATGATSEPLSWAVPSATLQLWSIAKTRYRLGATSDRRAARIRNYPKRACFGGLLRRSEDSAPPTCLDRTPLPVPLCRSEEHTSELQSL